MSRQSRVRVISSPRPGEVIRLRYLHFEPCKACNVCGERKDTGAYLRFVNPLRFSYEQGTRE